MAVFTEHQGAQWPGLENWKDLTLSFFSCSVISLRIDSSLTTWTRFHRGRLGPCPTPGPSAGHLIRLSSFSRARILVRQVAGLPATRPSYGTQTLKPS